MLNTLYGWCASPFGAASATSTASSAASQLTGKQTALIEGIFKGRPGSSCLSIEWRWNVANQNDGEISSFDFAPKMKYREVFEQDIIINTTSWYGAPEWNKRTWLSSVKTGVNGLLAIEEGNLKKFYPLPDVPQDVVPILIPACCKEGENGYICVLENDVVELGVSTWNIQINPPVQLFRQADFVATRFMDQRFLLAVDTQNQLVCWDLESKALKYVIDGWLNAGETYPYFDAFFPAQNMLFISNGSWMYAFKTNEKRFAYKIDLPSNSGMGVFQMQAVGEKYIAFREAASSLIQVYEVSTGQAIKSFSIGGGIDYMDIDDYPFCVYNNAIVALAADRKTIHFFDPTTGEVTKTFGPTTEYITGLHCTKDRLIANCECTTETVPKGYQDLVYIWDIDTCDLVKQIPPPDGYGLSPLDITDGILTIYLYSTALSKRRRVERMGMPKKALKEENGSAKYAKHKQAKLRLQTLHNQPEHASYQWTDPNPMMLDDNKICMQMWDTERGIMQKQVREEFIPPSEVTFAEYRARKFTVDISPNSAIIQKL